VAEERAEHPPIDWDEGIGPDVPDGEVPAGPPAEQPEQPPEEDEEEQ
jgi:hypothetical protein